MRKKKIYKRKTIEWKKENENIGIIIPQPVNILLNHIKNKNPSDIVNLFFSDDLMEINLLDLCVLNTFWVESKEILSARTSWFTHPSHHSSELVFDKKNERLKITIRQPDLDGEHWRGTHVHIVRGQIDLTDNCNIMNPFFNKHIKLLRPKINGKYIMKIK